MKKAEEKQVQDVNANPYVNKVVYGSDTLIDLTADTVTASDVASGKTFHDKSGASVTGTNTKDSDTSDATVSAAEMVTGKTAYARGAKITGTMPNVGQQKDTISTVAGVVAISQGYHDGSGNVAIDSTEQAKIVAGNIKEGVEILGVTGTHSGSESVKATTLSATPYTTAKTYLPSDLGDFTHFTQATVAAIAYTETDNSAGGKTVTIGTVAP